MKKALILVCLLSLCLSCAAPALAAGPAVKDYVLYSDIVATIDGHPIRSWNIGGYTAVMAEDLPGYGFRVIWDGTERTLRITRATRDGELATPRDWPDYQPETLTHPVGSRALPVYETDIVTYMGGERVESFNVGGWTLVWMDDLIRFGGLVWYPEEREIALTLGDPVQIALTPVIRRVESAGGGSSYQTYPCKSGTLLVYRFAGTPHGSSTGMLFVKNSGEKLSVDGLLPFYVRGAAYYLAPSQIRFDDSGSRLSFVTPVMELTASGESRELGDCLCVVDLNRGALVSLAPVAEIQ